LAGNTLQIYSGSHPRRTGYHHFHHHHHHHDHYHLTNGLSPPVALFIVQNINKLAKAKNKNWGEMCIINMEQNSNFFIIFSVNSAKKRLAKRNRKKL